MIFRSIFSVTNLNNKNLLNIIILVYLVCHAKNSIKISKDSVQMAKRALQHLQSRRIYVIYVNLLSQAYYAKLLWAAAQYLVRYA